MSRRLPPSSHCRIDPEGQELTIGPPANIYLPKIYSAHAKRHNGGGCQTIDTGLSDDDTVTDSQSVYYDDYYNKKATNDGLVIIDKSYSDDSGSTRIPIGLYEDDDVNGEDDESFNRRLSTRNTYSTERSRRNHHHHHFNYQQQQYRNEFGKDVRRVYPMGGQQQFGGSSGSGGQQHHAIIDRVYQEIPSQVICDQQQTALPTAPPNPRRLQPTSRLSDRPQSSMSSGMTSTIVDGCGGKCQTFENVCYFFLQMVFMMGILIGISLCIAGLVLRKSAARNLQVLVYIGILLAIVCSVLLGIQWNARSIAKKRKLAVRTAKRTAPILLETLNSRGQQQQPQHFVHHQPLMAVQEGNRIVPQIVRPVMRREHAAAGVDHQGVPWWRRKDVV